MEARSKCLSAKVTPELAVKIRKAAAAKKWSVSMWLSEAAENELAEGE